MRGSKILAILLGITAIRFSLCSQPQPKTSPIRFLEESLAASSAQSTVLAIQTDRGDCLVILSRSPKSPSSKLVPSFTSNQSQTFQKYHLKLTPSSTTASSSGGLQPLYVGPNTFYMCCMTGFTADVRHLVASLHRLEQSNLFHFGKPMGLRPLTQALASILERAARGDGRPYGVQALLFGHTRRKWGMFRTDPTGHYQHCHLSKFGVIGKQWNLIADELMLSLSSSDLLPRASIACALESIVKVAMKQNSPLEDEYKAVLLWTNETDGSCSLAEVHPDTMNEILASVLEKRIA